MFRKHINQLKYKKHLEKLKKECWWAVTSRKGYLRRSYFANAAKGFYKNYSNRQVRRGHTEHYHKGCSYKKVFDYWWQIW